MHLSSLQRENEKNFRSKGMPKNFSATSFTPMQSEGFSSSKWAGFFRPTGTTEIEKKTNIFDDPLL